MTKYFDLSPNEQSELIEGIRLETGVSPQIIEKDIWLSFVLQQVFTAPDRKPMAFKGGTSLSKVYSIIQRFSEDVDITIDYRSLGCDIPIADLQSYSGNGRKRLSETLKAQVTEYTSDVIRPHLASQIAALPCGDQCSIEISEDGEKIEVYYPTTLRGTTTSGYLRDHVLIEFGGRNICDPNETYSIAPDIAAMVPSVEFPVAEGVTVLAAERTFWEKATLIHASCHKGFPSGGERYSRHWYDLAMMCGHEKGRHAKSDINLLRDVIALKSVFFKSGKTHYDECLTGAFRLIPDRSDIDLLRKDYNQMRSAGMLNGHDFDLNEIFQLLAGLENELNKTLARG